jgi:hypothetical protein
MALIYAEHKTHGGLVMVQATPAGRSHRKPGLYFGELHVGYLVDMVALKQAFPCPTLSFHQCPTPILHSSTTTNYNISN